MKTGMVNQKLHAMNFRAKYRCVRNFLGRDPRSLTRKSPPPSLISRARILLLNPEHPECSVNTECEHHNLPFTPLREIWSIPIQFINPWYTNRWQQQQKSDKDRKINTNGYKHGYFIVLGNKPYEFVMSFNVLKSIWTGYYFLLSVM